MTVTNLFHASRHEGIIETFEPLTHFGTFAAATARAAGGTFEGKTARFYEVTLDVSNPLPVPDLFQANHSWLKLADQLHYDCGAISSRDRDEILRAGAPQGQNTAGGIEALVRVLRSKGYDALRYTNRHEDRGSHSWIILDPATVTVLSVDGEPVPQAGFPAP